MVWQSHQYTQRHGTYRPPHNQFIYNSTLTSGGTPVYIGLYIYDFVYFIEYNKEEEHLKADISPTIQIYWKRDSYRFLVT